MRPFQPLSRRCCSPFVVIKGMRIAAAAAAAAQLMIIEKICHHHPPKLMEVDTLEKN